MASFQAFNLGGLNLAFNPLLEKGGDFIRLVNMDSAPFGAKTKRVGYGTYLSSLGTRVETLLNWRRNTGTQFWNYAVAGGTIFYSTQGTGAWTVCGNGTVKSGEAIVNAVLADTLLISSPTGTTRHSTDGTSFTDTVGVGVAVALADYQNRIWAAGTSNTIFYSTTGTPTDWISDSSSIIIPGPGGVNALFKNADYLIATKNSGLMFKTDANSLIDLATTLGPTSNRAIIEKEGVKFTLNRLGYYANSGGFPQLISNPIQTQIYNTAGSGIAGTTFDNAPGGQFKYDIITAVGTTTDTLSGETINNCLQLYDTRLNEWRNWDLASLPTAFNTYKDTTGVEQLIFGDSTGQCYTISGTYNSDNTTPIVSTMEMIYAAGQPQYDKRWSRIWLFFNPGCEAQVQIACQNTFTKGAKNWINLGDAKSGVVEFKFPSGTRSKLLFIKINESSVDAPFTFYGVACDYDIDEGTRS